MGPYNFFDSHCKEAWRQPQNRQYETYALSSDRTEPRPQYMYKRFLKFDRRFFKYSSKQTDKHTNTLIAIIPTHKRVQLIITDWKSTSSRSKNASALHKHARIDGRTTRKHNASDPIHWMSAGAKSRKQNKTKILSQS